MVTIEVQLKEGDEEPEQHLDEGEHIERRVVPLDQLYEKLQGMFLSFSSPCTEYANCFRIVEGGRQDRGCQVCFNHPCNFRSWLTLTAPGSSTGLSVFTGLRRSSRTDQSVQNGISKDTSPMSTSPALRMDFTTGDCMHQHSSPGEKEMSRQVHYLVNKSNRDTEQKLNTASISKSSMVLNVYCVLG